jgi:hypothetical protein
MSECESFIRDKMGLLIGNELRGAINECLLGSVNIHVKIITKGEGNVKQG